MRAPKTPPATEPALTDFLLAGVSDGPEVYPLGEAFVSGAGTAEVLITPTPPTESGTGPCVLDDVVA